MATYTIKKGDTLTKIARANNTTVAELARINGIKDPNKIRAGATLNLTETPAAAPAPAPAPAAPMPAPVAATPAPTTAAPTPTVTAPAVDYASIAKSMLDPSYNADINALNANLAALDTYQADTSEDILRTLENDAIKRGMGRSTQYGDTQKTSLEKLARDVLAKKSEIETQKSQRTADYGNSLVSLQQQLEQQAFENQQAQQSAALAQQQADLAARQFAADEEQRKFENDLALKQLEMASTSSGGGGGGKKTGLTFEDVYNSGVQASPYTMGVSTPPSDNTVGDFYYRTGQYDSSKYRQSGSNKVPSNFTGIKGGKYYINGKVVTARQYAQQGA